MQTSQANDGEYQLHAMLYREDEWWIVQCLEHCIATQARAEEDLLADLRRILKAYAVRARESGAEPFAGIPRAPRRFWEMYHDDGTRSLDHLEVGAADGLSQVVELRAA